MTQPVDPTTPQDASISLEAHGLLDGSYDSLDALLHTLTQGDTATAAEQVSAPEIEIVGNADALLPAHLFL